MHHAVAVLHKLIKLNHKIQSQNKKIAINIVGNYKTLAIEDGATCGGAKISGFVLYADGSTFKVNPVSPTVSFKGTPKDWNNRPDKNGYTYLILEYTNKLSNVEDKINLASDTKYAIATKLTINGVAINEIYKLDTKTVLISLKKYSKHSHLYQTVLAFLSLPAFINLITQPYIFPFEGSIIFPSLSIGIKLPASSNTPLIS